MVADRMILQGPLILPHGMVEMGEVVVEAGRIAEISLQPVHAVPTIKLTEQWISPGLIDMHVHGGQGFDVMDGTEDALIAISQDLARHGTTGFLATTLTAGEEALHQTFDAIKRFRLRPEAAGGAEIVGVHMEGPFLSAAYQGAQNPAFLRAPSVLEMDRHAQQLGPLLKMMTIAPELEG
ncbi:MAG: amidohydrolase family protein, partial [Firmicutes bacterium]|nr:amidohydrolase family protein [Bacillota bacterium]